MGVVEPKTKKPRQMPRLKKSCKPTEVGSTWRYRDEVMIRKLSERVKTFYEILDERMNKVLGIAA
jgi:hypothetical protein